MKKICSLLLIALTISAFTTLVFAEETMQVTGLQGKAADGRDPDTTMGNSTQLMTRDGGYPDAKKSWLQFDISSAYAENPNLPGNFVNAKLTFYGAKDESGKSYAVYGLNDDAGLENWDAATLTWNNGPANDTTTSKGLIAGQTTSLYSTVSDGLDLISETPESDQSTLTAFVNTDTDGKITFIFTAGSTCYLWNVGQELEPVLTLTYELGNNPEKAHDPNPADDAVVTSTLSSLDWTNPDPNELGGVITCDVYLGTEPNKLDSSKMNKVELTAGISTVDINTTNFPTFGNLTDLTTYYWIVDIHDSTLTNTVEGEVWSLFVNNNEAPVVDAGPDDVIWLGMSGTADQELYTFAATVTDDGPIENVSYQWEQTSGTEVTIVTEDIEDPSVTFTATGTYEFQLTANDGDRQASDTVQIIVGEDACDASHMATGDEYNAADQNQDCIVDLTDLVALILSDWLNCTDQLADCGN